MKICDMCPANRIDHELDNNVFRYIRVCGLSDYRKFYTDFEKFPDLCPLGDYKEMIKCY